MSLGGRKNGGGEGGGERGGRVGRGVFGTDHPRQATSDKPYYAGDDRIVALPACREAI